MKTCARLCRLVASSAVASALLACGLPVVCAAQATAPQPKFDSVTANPDRTITFKYLDPAATAVGVALDGTAQPQPMTKGPDGVWSATTPAQEPEIYGYHFEVDGRTELDPRQPWTTINLLNVENMMEVPGADGPEPWDKRAVPHGEVHHIVYTTHVVKGLPQDQDDFFVYTPPNYDGSGKTKYPVLYLLHGYSDDASGWTAVGHANLILDSLIAEGKAKPMVVVMPLGYGDMSFVRNGFAGWRSPETVTNNLDLYQQALLTEVMPRVEKDYRVSTKRQDRAIAGLSMGGLESLSIGLNNTDRFASVGGFSSAAASIDQTKLAGLTPAKADLRVLWIACGTEDHLIEPNRQFIAFLKSKGMPVTAIETPGMHDWMVWRNNLLHFAPLLFQGR